MRGKVALTKVGAARFAVLLVKNHILRSPQEREQ
jgi:hypothetical protein